MRIDTINIQDTYSNQATQSFTRKSIPERSSSLDVVDIVEISSAALQSPGDGQVLPPVNEPIDV